MTHAIRILAAVVLLSAGAAPAAAITFVSPVKGATVKPGDVIAVRIAASAGEVISDVAIALGDATAPAAAVAGAPGEFEGRISVPRDGVGVELILVYANLTGGKRIFDYTEVTIDPGPLDRLAITTPRFLTRVGEVHRVTVLGHFSDGVARDLSNIDHGTTYTSSAPTVLAAAPGLIQARQTGSADLTVTSRGRTATVRINVNLPNPPTNQIPVVAVGPDQIVGPQKVVILSAAGTNDPDGDPLEYSWEQVAGRYVALREAHTAEPAFVSPRTDTEQTLIFSLAVRDNKGATTLPVYVTVIVRPGA